MRGKPSLFALAVSLFFFLSASASAQTCDGLAHQRAIACDSSWPDESPKPESWSWARMLGGGAAAGAVLRWRRSREAATVRN